MSTICTKVFFYKLEVVVKNLFQDRPNVNSTCKMQLALLQTDHCTVVRPIPQRGVWTW